MRAFLVLGFLAIAGEARRVHKTEERPTRNTARARDASATEAMQALSSALTGSESAAAFVPPASISGRFARPLQNSMGDLSMKEVTSKRDRKKKQREEVTKTNSITADDVTAVKTGYEEEKATAAATTAAENPWKQDQFPEFKGEAAAEPKAAAAKVQVQGGKPVVAAAAAAAPAPVAKPRSASVWNPNNVEAPQLPFVGEQFISKYFKESPTYLTGVYAGDIGFDPLCLVALANPNMDMDKTLRTAEARNKKMLSMSAEQQAESVAWMRDAELKHGRLAMLAAAGWPIAELKHGAGLASNGRAPSLFNGHLFDFLPALVLVFGALSYLEYNTKDTIKNGDYGFDPFSFSTEKSEFFKNAGNLEALKLAETKNGRAAMMAITGFAVQEFLWGTPVVQQTPFFFR